MQDSFTYLLPTFLSQILLGVLLLWLFVRSRDEIGLDRILFTSLIFSVLNVVIEWFLNDYLLATTLVFQWTIFVLMANRICAIPLPRASITLFCFFSLLMGGRMLEAHFSPKELSEEDKLLMEGFEKPKPTEENSSTDLSWTQRLKEGSIAYKTYASKNLIVDKIYSLNEDPVEPPLPTPKPQPAAQVQIPPQDPPAESTMTGKEFEALFYPQVYSLDPLPVVKVPTPVPTQNSFPEITYPENSTPRVRNSGASINAEQMTEIVEIRNHSTDPAYEAPDFDISAVSMGSQGRFAIVDGDMLREGSIIHTQLNVPRGWMLYRIEPTQIFWRPLK